MSEMIERVVSAIRAAQASTHSVDDVARAAIEAMREPTKDMFAAGYKVDITALRNSSSIYKAMIEEALK